MTVNGLRLPARLIELLEEGRWTRPSDVSVLAQMTGAERPEDFTFYSLDGMIRETAGNVDLWKEGYGQIYGLTSSSTPNQLSNPEFLDVDRAVLIAGNWNEEIIALDYRENLDEPKVVCGTWPGGRAPGQWKVIATTFNEFGERLGL